MKKPTDFECVLGGQPWNIHFVRRRHPKVGKNWGMCYWHDREIYVRYDLSEKNFVDTLLHEIHHSLTMLHFSAEPWICQTSTEMTEALLKSGVGVRDGIGLEADG